MAKAGRLDEAEGRYSKNVKAHDCAWCWLAYAKFLIEYREDRTADARVALEKAELLNGESVVSPEEIAKWRERVDGVD